MEVHLSPELEAQLNKAVEETGRPADEINRGQTEADRRG